MVKKTDLLIIGAGPFGLSLASRANHLGIENMVVGEPMDFWKSNMPKGMFLRSGCDWHLDPQNVHTIEAFLRVRGLTEKQVMPISLEFYLEYVRWFQERKGIEPVPALVTELDHSEEDGGYFSAQLDDGETVRAKQVAIAVGFKYFKHFPDELAELLPPGSFSHTCNLVDFAPLRDKRCLIIGGRQSAFEWAALLTEAGAAAVHVSHRHKTPAFSEADWSWANQVVAGMVENPDWYRNLSAKEQEEASLRLWSEGRLKLEPWLWPRVDRESVKIWPETHVVAASPGTDGEFEVRLNTGATLEVDHVVLATGYRVNIANVPFLKSENLLRCIETRNGSPVLDEGFQSSIPGLYFTSLAAAQDFGPFLGFTINATASAKIMGRSLAAR